MPSRHISVDIEASAESVAAFASDPANLPAWASGLGSSGELVDGRWEADAPFGRVVVAFVEANPFGVLDHDVTLPTGEVVRNPLRVLPDGPRCEVVFSLRRPPDISDEEHEQDAATIQADLETLKGLVESR